MPAWPGFAQRTAPHGEDMIDLQEVGSLPRTVASYQK
jgi:hypothetical protein